MMNPKNIYHRDTEPRRFKTLCLRDSVVRFGFALGNLFSSNGTLEVAQ